MYAGSTASLPAHAAKPPMPNSRNRMYFASISETRPPYFRKNHGVTNGSAPKTTTLATTKISVRMVNGAKIKPSAITVPRSFTKQAARMPLPKSVRFKPSSSMTEYTTAIEVVDRATPANQLAGMDHRNTKCATAAAPRNGAKKPTNPTTMASFHFVRNMPGSSSAPARNVSTIAPVPARKLTQADFAPSTSVPIRAPMMSCATVPTTISERAVEILNQIESSVAINARMSHNAAENQTCSIPVSDMAQVWFS